MAQIVGTYKLEKNDNLDAFYEAAGVPWIARKMMLMSSPTMHVNRDKDDNEEECWLIKTVSFIRTVEQSFKLDNPYEEKMPNDEHFMSTAKMVGDNKIVIKSYEKEVEEEGDGDKDNEEKEKAPTQEVLRFEREYDFTEEGVVITLKHPNGVEAKRYFKRI